MTNKALLQYHVNELLRDLEYQTLPSFVHRRVEIIVDLLSRSTDQPQEEKHAGSKDNVSVSGTQNTPTSTHPCAPIFDTDIDIRECCGASQYHDDLRAELAQFKLEVLNALSMYASQQRTAAQQLTQQLWKKG